MSHTENDFSHPQNQSKLAIAVFFTDVFYRVFRGGGIIAIIILIRDGLDSSTLLYVILGIGLLAVLSAVWGILAFFRFKFHIDYENREFILQKGVLSSSITAVPFDKIQQVYLKRSIIQRILNVYRLKIDTAGSKEDEVDIKALSKQEALQLKEILMQSEAKNSDINQNFQGEEVEKTQEKTEKSTAEKTDWQYHVSIGTLLKIGLTSNWFRGIWIMLIFFNQIYQEIQSLVNASVWWNDFESFLEGFQGIIQILVIMAVAFIALIFIGIIITLAEVFIKYYNLSIEKKNDRLQLEMGLTTTTQFTLKPRRVQLFKISTNPIQKRLGLYSSDLHLGNSQDDLDKTKIKLPGLENSIIKKLKTFLYQTEKSSTEVFHPHKALLIRRFIFSLIPVGILWASPFFIENLDYNYLIFGIISVLYLLPMLWFQRKVVQSYSLSINGDFIIKQKGFWTQKTEIIELYKLQGISTNQAYWFKNRNIENVTFHTAGGDLSFPLVNQSEIKSRLNYIFYAVETTDRAWM
jgi:putative membrane protein